MKIKSLILPLLMGLYGFSQTTFTSISSGDWDDPNIWQNGNIPTPGGMVMLMNDVTINSTSNVDTIEVSPNASLTVGNSGNLTLNSLDLKSNSTSYSSLILDGTITGTVNYNRYINQNASSGGNDLISVPLSSQAFNDFVVANPNILAEPDPGTRVLFGNFNTDTSTYSLWDEADTRILNPGEGYRSGSIDTNGYNFTGDVNTGTIDVPINVGGATRWNLIGNPYPSYVVAQSFLTNNTGILDPNSTAIYGYNDSTDETSAGNRNRYTIINFLQNNTKNISPGQGFFLASGAAGGLVQFQPNMRTIIGGDDFIQGRQTSTTNLKLKLTKGSNNFITDFYFTELATLGLDPGYDAKIFGESAPTFSIYSHLVEENNDIPFAVQALGKTDYGDTTIALGINTDQGEQITISIDNSTLPSTTNVYLDDNVSNTSTLLNSSDYILTPNTNLNGTGRFFLRFTDSALSINDNTFNTLNIHMNKANKAIIIEGQLLESSMVNIYDAQGRSIIEKELNTFNTSHTIDVSSLKAGVYIIQINNTTQSKTQKIIISN